jgi:hypothetical protein
MWVYHTPKLVSKNTCPEKNVDPPTKKQSSAYIVVKVMGERGKVPFFPEDVRSPKEVRSFALVLRYGHGRTRSYTFGCMARVRTITLGGAIVRFLSRFSAFEKVPTNDRLRRCDRLQEQNVTSHKIN